MAIDEESDADSHSDDPRSTSSSDSEQNNNRQRAKATSRIKLLSTQPPKDNASSILIDHRANTVPTEISASDVNKYAARLLDRLFT